MQISTKYFQRILGIHAHKYLGDTADVGSVSVDFR